MGWQQPGPVARAAVVTALVATVMLSAGCARVTPSPGPSSTTSASADATSTATPTAGSDAGSSGQESASAPASSAASPAGSSATSPASPSASGSGGATATQLTLTSVLQREILTTAAAYNKLPVTAYAGLMPGMTYLARDAAGDLWVGTSLEPSASSIPAQVSVQDNGSYLLLRRSAGGDWTVWAVGLATPQGCAAVGLPLTVSSLWGWAPTACRPGGTQ